MINEIIVLLIFIFTLSVFLGFELILKVPSTLHTPLMSATNAISGITLIGAISILIGEELTCIQLTLSIVSVFLSTINVVGGYLITHHMLLMFKNTKKGTVRK